MYLSEKQVQAIADKTHEQRDGLFTIVQQHYLIEMTARYSDIGNCYEITVSKAQDGLYICNSREVDAGCLEGTTLDRLFDVVEVIHIDNYPDALTCYVEQIAIRNHID